MIRLIATDIDGTLLTSRNTDPPRSITPRTLAALAAARDAGILVVPASGRQPFSIADALAGTFLAEGIALGANGAIGVHLGTRETYFERLLAPEAQRRLFEGLVDRYPGVRCVSVRDGGDTFVPQHGYTGFMDPGDHGRAEDLPEFPLDEVLCAPSLKFVVRDPSVPTEELLRSALDLNVPGCTPVTSGAPFVEVAADGVDKGFGLAALCAHLGIEAAEVVAFGDELNDLEMIRWAGHGVAMGNGADAVKVIADEVAPTNDDEGLALVVEGLLER